MMLSQVLEVVGYDVRCDGQYLWSCYGNEAMYMGFSDVMNRPIGSIIFDTSNANVYEITVEVPGEPLAYRWVDPDFKADLFAEALLHDAHPTQAWDDVHYIDLEMFDDMMEKIDKICKCEEFSRNVSVPINLTEEEELALHRSAHAAGMSTNEFVNDALRRQIATEQKALDERYIR